MKHTHSFFTGWYEDLNDQACAWFHDGSGWSGWQYVSGELLFQTDPTLRTPPPELTLVRRQTSLDEIAEGDVVRHHSFGLGVVLDVYGTGKKTEAVVMFLDVGTKHLALAWAKLEKLV